MIRVDNGGFSLVEIMVVVLIMGVLAAIVAPYYVRAREEAKAKACLALLKEIEGAKDRWAASMDVDRWAEPFMTDLIPHFLKSAPVCPSGGEYTLGRLDFHPVCSVGTQGTDETYDDHVLYGGN